MANKEIFELTAASSLTGTELVHVVQSGNSRKTTVDGLAAGVFKTSATFTNAQFASASFKLFNAAGTPRALTFNTTALTADRVVTWPDEAVDFTAKTMFDAVVNFNGTGTLSTRGNKGFLGVTDNGVGQFQPNFTSAAPSANYAVFASCRIPAAGNIAGGIIEPFSSFNGSTHQDETPTTSGFKIKTFVPGASNATDPDYVFIGVVFFP